VLYLAGMKRTILALSLFLCSVPALSTQQSAPQPRETALDKYIAKTDSVYGWKLVSRLPGDGYQAFVLELTSQTWRTEKDVDRPVWKHWLTVIKPDRVTSSKALLYIGSGNNLSGPPKSAPERATMLAIGSNSIVADLGQVPNQPLFFSDSKDKSRSEDDLIAYTRVKHMATKDDEWLVRLAMVKSGVRAMDAVQEFMASTDGGGLKIDGFFVTGGSKRGWTTWLVGVVDKRVIGIAPMVIDALNSEAITRHHYEAYGFFSPSLNDYVNHGLFPGKIGTPEYRAILAIEDPYNYLKRERLRNIPKFVMNASGDQFFLPDNSQFYFEKIEGEKHLRYVANAKHDLAGTDARETLLAYYISVLEGRKRPVLTWKAEGDGTLVVKPKDAPAEVLLWSATNPKARDFRVDTIGKAYTSTVLKPQADGSFIGKVEKPAQGFTAFYVELIYTGYGKYPLKFTTDVRVIPDTLPHKFPK
jgi:PhoPQ-activated pathogenicity-related protein